MTFKYNIDQPVYSKWDEEVCEIVEKRVVNGNPCYLLDNGKERHEAQLYEMPKKPVTKRI